MNAYNLTNLDIDAKKTLEAILRPSAHRVIEPWLAQSTQKQKKQILIVRDIATMIFDDIKPTGANAYGKPAVLRNIKSSVDLGQQQFYMRRSNSEVLNRPQREARDHFREFEPVQTNSAVQRYYICDQDGPRQQPFSKLLKPQIVNQLDQWQVFGGATPQLQAEVCQILRTLDLQSAGMPTYATMQASLPGMARGPLLHQYSRRHQLTAMRRNESFQTKLEGLQRTASEPTIHEHEFTRALAQIKVPGGDAIELQDLPPIQYAKARQANSVCKINFAGGSQDPVSSYTRHYPAPPQKSGLGLPKKKEPWRDGSFTQNFN